MKVFSVLTPCAPNKRRYVSEMVLCFIIAAMGITDHSVSQENGHSSPSDITIVRVFVVVRYTTLDVSIIVRFITSSLSTCAPDGHRLRVTIPDATSIQLNLLMMSI